MFALVAVALFAAAPAAGASEQLGRGDVVEGQLSAKGPDVFYTLPLKPIEQDRKGIDVIRAGAAGSERVGRLRGPGSDRDYFGTDFDASPSLYAVGTWEVRDDGEDFIDQGGASFFGPLGGKLRAFEDCTGPDSPDPQVAVDGDVVAVAPCGGVTVFDMSPGAAVPVRNIPLADDNNGELRLAGKYVAFVDDVNDKSTSPDRFITVYDWTTGTEVYRARASAAVPIAAGPLYWFDLQSDGTLVYASSRIDPPEPYALRAPCADRYGIAWASVASPVGQLVPGVNACLPDVRVGAGRVAFFRRAGARGTELMTAGLDGSALAEVALVGDLRMLQAFDFDGLRAGVAVKGCVTRTVFALEGSPAAPDWFPLPDCPVTIARRTASLSSH